MNGHEKRGAYVGSHLHLNVTYLAQANPDDPLKVKPDENSALKWVPLDDAVRLSSEPWIRDRIYRKLIAKTPRLRQFEPAKCYGHLAGSASKDSVDASGHCFCDDSGDFVKGHVVARVVPPAFVGFEHAAQNEACVVLGVFQGPKAVRRALTFNGFDPIGRHGRNKGA